jgi:hypothetical protein
VEVFVVIKEHSHALSEYRRGWIRSPLKPTLWDLGLGLAGGILVAIGVAGELGIDFKAAAVEGELRNANRSLAGLLNTEIARLRLETAKANERSARLQSLMGPRTLTEEQQQIIVARLSKFPHTEVDLFVFEGDEWTRFESLAFASLLSSVMDKARFETRVLWGAPCNILRPLVGITVLAKPEASPQERTIANEIREALGDSVDLAYFPQDAPDCIAFSSGLERNKPPRGHAANIKIIIGSKPPAMPGRPTMWDIIRPPAKK